jgi:hypothetical protein
MEMSDWPGEARKKEGERRIHPKPAARTRRQSSPEPTLQNASKRAGERHKSAGVQVNHKVLDSRPRKRRNSFVQRALPREARLTCVKLAGKPRVERDAGEQGSGADEAFGGFGEPASHSGGDTECGLHHGKDADESANS